MAFHLWEPIHFYDHAAFFEAPFVLQLLAPEAAQSLGVTHEILKQTIIKAEVDLSIDKTFSIENRGLRDRDTGCELELQFEIGGQIRVSCRLLRNMRGLLEYQAGQEILIH